MVRNPDNKDRPMTQPIKRRWSSKQPELSNPFTALQEPDEQEFPELTTAVTNRSVRASRLQAPRPAKRPNQSKRTSSSSGGLKPNPYKRVDNGSGMKSSPYKRANSGGNARPNSGSSGKKSGSRQSGDAIIIVILAIILHNKFGLSENNHQNANH